MIKKCLFAVALLAFVAMTVQAGDLARNPIKVDSMTAKDPNILVKGQLVPNVTYMPPYNDRGDYWPSRPVIYWPYEICYKPLEICQIPVYMEVGAYAEFQDCGGRDTKIVLKQVDCATLTPDPRRDGKENLFPCYSGCLDIGIRANFPAKLGTVLYRMADSKTLKYAIDVYNNNPLDPKWRAYFTTKYLNPGNLIPASATFVKTQVCIDAWSADIFAVSIGTEIQVGEVAITIVPQ